LFFKRDSRIIKAVLADPDSPDDRWPEREIDELVRVLYGVVEK